jgi:regulator of sigma E protease
MDILIKASQFIMSLSLLVILHEFGHFIPAKLFKTRVEKFYLFFNPKFSLYKKKIKDTEWGIGWLPLGGYVKIAGMVDESMDTEQLKQPAQPWEFRSKKAWQRLIIMIGGVVVNIILGLIIYIGVSYYYGEERLDPTKLEKGLAVHPYLKKYGIVSGDEILSVDGEKVTNVMEVSAQVMMRGAQDLKVKHSNGKIQNIHFPDDIEYELFQAGAFPMVSLRSTALSIDSVLPKSNALQAGLKKGDQFVAINGNSLTYFDEIQRNLFENKGKKIEARILRGKDTINLNAFVTLEGTLGYVSSGGKIIDEKLVKEYKPGFIESIGLGYKKASSTLQDYAGQLKFMFTKKGASSIGGFARMGNMFPSSWDWHIFWLNTAFLSLALAIMNILPIPALDGGHVVFLLYEMITGKEAPQKVLEYAQYVGIVLLLTLMVYANGNDIYRIFFK